uniref:Methyltransferase type 11 domain-containing protein n=1 Tax=Branchiostoma floridae TaxID=7739 RepID=C3ZP27_BRAFL|eukprot:XP_002589751.1 hypothetical protein BRAFLDRAFT_97801 [Branchiostoma floridae]
MKYHLCNVLCVQILKRGPSGISDPKLNPEMTAKHYDNWSGFYEESPSRVSLDHFLTTRPDLLTAANPIAHAACAHETLVQLGFTDIDGVDGSQDMLNLAERKQIYNRLICDFVGPNRLDIENDTYDAIACAGGFAPSHLKEDCLPELIRVVKPGGFIVITFREEYLYTVEHYKDKLEPTMARLQDEGLWERVSREVFPGFYGDKDGITFVYKVL